MTARRRFFPARSVQQVPGGTVDLALRMQRAPAAPAAQTGGAPGPGDPTAPYWVGWLGDDEAPATALSFGYPNSLDPFVFWEDTKPWPFVVHVDGGVDVEWGVSFVPTFWKADVGVVWEGAPLLSTHPAGYAGLPATRSIELPDLTAFDGPAPGSFFRHESEPGKFGLAYEPMLLAAGNTLTLVMVPGTCPGVVQATARVGATVLGSVTYTGTAVIPA